MAHPHPPLIIMEGVAIVMLAFICVTRAQGDGAISGPKFTKEPPGTVEFMNTKGMSIDCTANGVPPPSITWVSVDNTPVVNISAIRVVQSNGTLVMHPFRSEQYRPDVHAATLRCLVTNSVGTISSLDVQLRAVLEKPYDIQVYDTYAIEGNTALFKCHIPAVINEYVTVLAWIKNDNLLIQTKETEGSTDKYAIMPNGELHIRDVNPGEAGTKYKCKTIHRLTANTQISSSAGTLFVTESRGTVPPSIQKSISSISIKKGDTAVLPCVAQGKPAPLLKWHIKSISDELKDLAQNDRYIKTKSSLIIHGVTHSDEAVYICEASSELGKQHISINLFVVDELQVTLTPAVQIAKVGDATTFNCETGSSAITSVKWLHNGAPKQNLSGKSFQIPSIDIADQGMYQCVVKHSSYTSQASAELRLSEIMPYWIETFQEVAVYPVNPASLQCVAAGIPLPVIMWSMDGIPIQSDSRHLLTSTVDKNGRALSNLKIHSTIVEDGGLYSCIASNHGGKARHSARLNIYGPLQIRDVPSLIAVSGEDITLNCPVYGYPWTAIYWEKDGVKLPVELRQTMLDNGSLHIDNVRRPNDNGKFLCHVESHDQKNVQGFIDVQVMVPPKIVPFEFQDELLREGMRARLQCVVSDGDVPLNVTWLKDHKPISPNTGVVVRTLDEFSSILTIGSISPSHNGNYTCVASNKAATVIYTAELSVNVRPKIVPFPLKDEHYEGTPARLVCGLLEGDPPIHFVWLKDNLPIHENKSISVHHIDGLSSILSIGRLTAEHAGNYTCLASNDAGSDMYSATMRVHVAPKIVPFSFQGDHVFEGALARLTCVVYQGDLPLTIHWQKDGITIPTNLGISIHNIDTYTSILTIDHVHSKHGGNYSCIAENKAATASHSAFLTVNVPPRWIFKPTDAIIVWGKGTMIDCQAEGFPKPTITWLRKKSLAYDGKSEIIRNGENSHIFQNGSLFIPKTTADDTGYYFCQVTNGIGNSLSHMVNIQVHVPPNFQHKKQVIQTRKGVAYVITCASKGDSPLTITWYKYNKKLQNDSNTKYTIVTKSSEDEISSELTIANVSRRDNGSYQCLAKNDYGSDRSIIELLVLENPDAPKDVKTTSQGSREISLSWIQPYNGNLPIQSYTIEYFPSEARSSKLAASATGILTIPGQQLMAVIRDLLPATAYSVKVFAENSEGKSKGSDTIIVTTAEEAPTGPPINVQVENIDHETIKVSWKPPVETSWNGRLQGYYVGFKEMDSSDGYSFKTLLTADPTSDDLSVQISGMKRHTKYLVVVQAYNNQGKGPLSPPVRVMTSEGAPRASPTDVRCTTLTSQSIHVTWIAPTAESVNGILKGYKVVYKPSSEWFDEFPNQNNITTATTATLNELNKFTNYSISVLAYTKSGNGPMSEPIFCKTLDDVPGPIMDMKAVAADDTSVIVSWKAPESVNGILKSYNVYWKAANNSKAAMSHAVSSQHNHYEVSNLSKGRQYEFWVTSSTLVGAGKPSRVLVQSPNGPTVPARIVSFDDKVVTPWKTDISLPCFAVGRPDPIRKWTLKGKVLESAGKLKILADGTLSIKEVEERDAGDYDCGIFNELGEDRITYTVIILAPPSPPELEIISTTSSAIEVQWKVTSNKLAKVKGFTLHLRKGDGEWEEIPLGVDIRKHKTNRLECGTRYELFMTAFNKIGTGLGSEVMIASTNGSVPLAPNKLELIEETSDAVSLYLNTWKSNGCPILYYTVEYAPKHSKDWTFVSNNIKPEQRRLVIPGLMPGTWYSLRMTAHNSAGSSVAEYNFATLSKTGATISPELIDEDGIKGIIAYLNLYVTIPVSITVVVLLAILAVACFYVKRKKAQDRKHKGQRFSTPSTTDLHHGGSVNSFAYMQRNTLSRQNQPPPLMEEDLLDDPTPYATCHLSSHPPPLPPPNVSHPPQAPPMSPSRFRGNLVETHPMNPQFLPPPPRNFLLGQSAVETTFIFPQLPEEDPTPHVNIMAPTYTNTVNNGNCN